MPVEGPYAELLMIITREPYFYRTVLHEYRLGRHLSAKLILVLSKDFDMGV